MKTPIYIITFVLSLSFLSLSAQESAQKQLRFDANVGFGISGLTGTIEDGKVEPGTGLLLSGSGTWFFNQHLGVGLGLRYATYNSTASLTAYNANIPSVDDEGESFEYRISGNDLNEDLKLSALGIPVFVAYQMVINEQLTFISKLGIMALLPMDGTYKYTNGTTETRGYYANDNVELFDLPNHGFESIENLNYTGDLETQTSSAIIAELGLDIDMNGLGINVGISGSYGISPILKSGEADLIVYPNQYQSISSLSDNISSLSLLLMVGVSF